MEDLKQDAEEIVSQLEDSGAPQKIVADLMEGEHVELGASIRGEDGQTEGAIDFIKEKVVDKVVDKTAEHATALLVDRGGDLKDAINTAGKGFHETMVDAAKDFHGDVKDLHEDVTEAFVDFGQDMVDNKDEVKRELGENLDQLKEDTADVFSLRQRKKEKKEEKKEEKKPVETTVTYTISYIINSIIAFFAVHMTEYISKPDRLTKTLTKKLRPRMLLVMAILWFPQLIISGGIILGLLLHLGIDNFNLVVGWICGVYVYLLLTDKLHPPVGYHKHDIVKAIVTIAPIYVLVEKNFYMIPVDLFAFSGTPFLIQEFFTMKKEQKQSEAPTLYFTAAGAVLGLSIGNSSAGVRIVLCLIFAGLIYCVKWAPSVEKMLPLADVHKHVARAVAIILIAQIAFVLSSIVIPSFILGEVNGIFGCLGLTFAGVNMLITGHLFDNDLLHGKVEGPMLALAEKVYTLLIVISYLVMLVHHVVFGLFAYGSSCA